MTDTIAETQNILDQLQSLYLPRARHKPTYADAAKALMQSEPANDGSKEVSNLEGIDESTSSSEAISLHSAELISNPTTSSTPHENPVPFELWETLAYDLALANTDTQTIASAYDLTIDQLYTLQENPYFAKILQAKQDEVKQLGSDATFAVKMRMVANRATPQLLRRLTDQNTTSRDFLAMFKTVTELGQLIPQPNQADAQQSTLIGANVTFNISGVPGLDHLSSPVTIDAETTNKQPPTSNRQPALTDNYTTQATTTYDTTTDYDDTYAKEVLQRQINKLFGDELGEL